MDDDDHHHIRLLNSCQNATKHVRPKYILATVTIQYNTLIIKVLYCTVTVASVYLALKFNAIITKLKIKNVKAAYKDWESYCNCNLVVNKS